LKVGYKKLLAKIIKKEAIAQNSMQMQRRHYGGDSLVLCFVNDCLEKGFDIDRAGARYNWIMPSFVGVANLMYRNFHFC